MTALRVLERPPRLRTGDAVAVVATSGRLEPDRLARGVALLESWQLHVRVAAHALDRDAQFPHLAGTDADRAQDFADAWRDPDVRAVLVGRGGSGAARLLDLLDWSRMRAAGPKALVGFSDVTALHQAVATRLGLVSLFGPMPAAEAFGGESPDHPTIDHLRATLFEPEKVQTLTADTAASIVGGSADGVVIGGTTAASIVGGSADGVVIGGTLSLVAASCGTPEYRPAAGGIAVLEDVAEPPYRLDTHLTQLQRAGWFDGVRGVVLGSWTDCAADTADTLAARLAPLGVPILAGMSFGHCTPALTIPLGVAAILDATAGTLTLREPALA